MTKKNVGNTLVIAAILLNLVLWLVFMPENTIDAPNILQLVGEIIASTVMILISITLILSARPRFIEPYFGGLDKMWKSHRSISMIAFLLVIFHFFTIPKTDTLVNGKPIGMLAFFGMVILIIITIAPRAPFFNKFLRFSYTRWRIVHKLLGVFFILGLVHYFTVVTLSKMTIPGSYMLLFSVTGILFYLYRQFLSRFFEPYRSYSVEHVNKLNAQTVEVVLKPKKKPIKYRAGQFAYVYFSPGRTLKEPHPFTISSAPNDNELRFTIKASGDWTNHLVKHLEPGMKAAIHGGFGEFDFSKGKNEQVWIAGGIGVTPFLSWLRSPGVQNNQKIDFFYSVRSQADVLFWDEIAQIANTHQQLSANLKNTAEEGYYTIDEILDQAGGNSQEKEYYLCGPVGMIETFNKQLRENGVPANQIHFEEFNFR